jgi:hypothetical protein
MAKPRLVDLYSLQTEVEIMLNKGEWQAGRVTAHQHPGIWVVDTSHRSWFVTNRRRIRPVDTGQEDHEA